MKNRSKRRKSIRGYVPSNYNPPPRFSLRLPRCRECGAEVLDNPIVNLGGGILAKFGLCSRCLSDQMEEYRRWDEEFAG